MAANSLMRKVAIWVMAQPDNTADANQIADQFDLTPNEAAARIRAIVRTHRIYTAALAHQPGETPAVKVTEVKPVKRVGYVAKKRVTYTPKPAAAPSIPNPEPPKALQLMPRPRLPR
ncbi:hypothetical protein AVP3_0036 [Aeromonas phage AVP3]